VTLAIDGQSVDVELPLVGHHNAINAAGAAAVAMALGFGRAEIAAGLSRVEVPGGRLRILRDARPGVHVVDDTYNANPASMRAAFSVLAELAEGRRVAVLGDMFELGPEAPALHREVGAAAATSGVDWVLAIGPNAEQTAAGARDAGAAAAAFNDVELLALELDAGLQQGDWVVVKGSRGMRMERIVERVSRGET
jgi:UDP-N-acetylmuramoyl-tripeptide--D-alanyl-D-alanine ligase